MKKVISFFCAIIFATAPITANAESFIYENSSIKKILEEEIAVFDCEKEVSYEETISYDSVITDNLSEKKDELDTENEKEYILSSSEYIVSDSNEYSLQKEQESFIKGLQRIVNPSSLDEYRSIVYIDVYVKKNGVNTCIGRGSGYMIGPNSVVTAGHVINSDSIANESSSGNRWASKVIIYPAKAGSNNPYGSASSTNLITSVNWIDNNNPDYDWGIIRLNKNIGDNTGWLGLRWTSSHYHGKTIMFAGYPDGDIYNKYMYYGCGVQNSYKDNGLIYVVGDSCEPGHSGCPSYLYFSDTGYTAIGIVTNKSSNGFGYLKLSEWLYNELVSYRNKRANTYK